MDQDVVRLTKDAENGNGCTLKYYLADQTFDQSVTLLDQIAKQNEVNRAGDAQIPTLSFSNRSADSPKELQLRNSKLPVILFTDTLSNPEAVQGHMGCWDLS